MEMFDGIYSLCFFFFFFFGGIQTACAGDNLRSLEFWELAKKQKIQKCMVMLKTNNVFFKIFHMACHLLGHHPNHVSLRA